MITGIETCPACGSDELYRSRTRTRSERMLRLLFPVHYFRCIACGWREPVVNASSWKDWRGRMLLGLIPFVLGLLLAGGILYLGFEGSRQVRRPEAAAGQSEQTQ